MKYTKDEMIAIGQLLNSVNKFEKSIHINNLPDPKNADRIYVQIRSSAMIDKKRIWFGKYVGVKDRHTAEDLAKARESLIKRYHDHVNQELAQYNCQISDFK